MFLCNTTGSGKTRLLLEGLWSNWGFYFTARTYPENIGSSDFAKAMRDMERLTPVTDVSQKEQKKVEAQNRDFVARRVLLILYIRMFVFRIYLECAKASGQIKDEHKGWWLLLQLAPPLFLGDDVFTSQFRKLKGADRDTLDSLIQTESESIKMLLRGAPIFCVLDEAQIPSNQFKDHFLSGQDSKTKRPILGQIIQDWVEWCPDLIVSGTGLSMREIDAVLSSVGEKTTGKEPELVTDVGAFDTAESQRAYLWRYLPPDFLDPLLASRIEYWLRGRYLITPQFNG